jgi:hypothetical protein
MQQSLMTPIPGSDYYGYCFNNPDLCYTGNIVTDLTVVHYYFGSNKYVASHSPSFCVDLLSNANAYPEPNRTLMLACAVGGCLHNEADLASHGSNGMVQYAIKHSFLANSVIHVFAEQHLDNILESKYPALGQESYNFLESAEICKPLFVQTLSGEGAYSSDKNSVSEVSGEYDNVVTEVQAYNGGVYDPAFQSKSFLGTFGSLPWTIEVGWITIMLIFCLIVVLLTLKIIKKQATLRHWIGLIIFIMLLTLFIWLFYNAINSTVFSALIMIIKPLSNLVPIGDYQGYLNMGVQNSVGFFSNGEINLLGKDPSGVAGKNAVLNSADSGIMTVDYIILGLIILFFLWFIWFILKKNKVINKGFIGGLDL